MIPTPRPGHRFGDCPDCGRQHDGECHLAELVNHRTNTLFDAAGINWVSIEAERMVAEKLAGSTEMQHRGPNGDLYALPSPVWRRMDG